ncbi:MAG TPA: hypothetical protein VNT59_01600, partial [Ramlibacter sp.]|nr:hypothetical protein [Ramlibacter sp.]
QSAVGAASLATGGLAGQGLRALGYDPQAANQMLAEYLSPQQRESEQAVQDAEGFVDTMIAAAKNPRAVAGSVVESVPGMLGIGAVTNAVARRIALKAAAPFGGLATEAGQKAAQEAVDAATNKLLLASGIGEGGQSAGQIADQAQAAGRDYSQYALPALAAGATTAAITRGAGKLMGSAETALFSGSKAAGPQGSLPVRLAKAAFSEGALQEMPQSAQEQAMTNIAMGEPDVMKGVGNQAAMGLVTGGVMGLGEGAGAPHQTAQKAAADAVRKQDTVPEVGPLSAAANVATEAKAQAIENAPPAPPVEEPAPVIDPIAERIQRMQGQDREDAMHAYGIVQRDDVPKGVRQYNSKLLDKLLEKYEHPAERPMDMTASDTAIPTPEWGTERGAAPDRGALDFQRDIPTGDLALAQERPLLALPAPVVTVDNAGQAATGAQLAEREQAAQAEARRKRELGLTPDVEQAAQTRAAPKPAAAVTPPATAAEKPATAAAALPADILAKSGKPFASRLPAMNAAKKAGPGHEVVQVPGGFAVRKTGDWQAFPATTGTLGLPRAELPQVHAQAHGALVNFLTARGIEHQTEEVDPASLKPSQAEYSEAKAAEQAGSDSERAILVSSDGHVVDGHHLWLAAGAEGKPVKVIRFNAPADKLLPIVKEFPSAKSAQATAEAAAPAAVPAGNGQAAEVQPRADVADRANGAAEQPHATLTEAAKAAEKGQDHAPDQQHEQGRVQQERGSRDEGRQAAEAGGSDRVQRAAPGSEAERSRSGEAGDQGKVANEKTPPASDTAGAADKPLTLGITPASAEPITVRGGVIYVGKDPALNYDTGEPVTVAEDATSEQIKQAMKDAGAVSKRQHFYGGKAVEAESGKAAAPGTSAAAASEGESHGQGQKEEVLKAAGEQSPAGEAAPTKEDAAPAKSERTAAEIAREIAKDRPDEDFAAVREAARKAIVAELGQKAADEMGRGNFLAGDELTQAVHDGQYEAVREYAAKMPVPVHESDIPRETANRAYMGTSHNPERRGASAQRDYVRQMVQAWKAAERAAGNDPQAVARITEAMQSLVSGYRQRYLASLASHANVMSAMIAGPANFPVERNRKRIAAADKRAQDASEFLQKGIARMLKAAKAPVDNSPQSELDRIKANLSEREAAQEKMRAANAALRKGDDAALKALGFSDERIAALKKGDFAGRKGFADYQLANNNAEIRRLRERLASAQQRVTEAEAGPVERTY